MVELTLKRRASGGTWTGPVWAGLGKLREGRQDNRLLMVTPTRRLMKAGSPHLDGRERGRAGGD